MLELKKRNIYVRAKKTKQKNISDQISVKIKVCLHFS